MAILVICLVGLMMGSCFGIFFSNEDTGTMKMKDVVKEINAEYLDKVVDVLSARGNLVEHQFSEHIILHRIPIFNKVYELMREGAKHGVLGEVGNVLTAHQTGIDINVNLVGACGLERGLCALIIRLKLKTEDRANAKQAHHDKAIALQQPHSFSIKDCTSPYSYTFPYIMYHAKNPYFLVVSIDKSED